MDEMTWKTHPSDIVLSVRVKDRHNYASSIYTLGSTVASRGVVKKLTQIPYTRFIRTPLLYAKKHRAWHLLEFKEEDYAEVMELLMERMSVRDVQQFQGQQLQARKKQGLKYGIDNSRIA